MAKVSEDMLRVLALVTARNKSDQEAWRVLMPEDAGPEATRVITDVVTFAAIQAALVAELADSDEHEYLARLRGSALARQAATAHLDMLAAHEAAGTCYQCGASTAGRGGWICVDCGTGEPDQ